MDSIASTQAGAAFEALLLVPILRPAFGGDAALGDYGIDLLAREIAAHDRSGFAALIDAALERRS